jgi:hypothetical protein
MGARRSRRAASRRRSEEGGVAGLLFLVILSGAVTREPWIILVGLAFVILIVGVLIALHPKALRRLRLAGIAEIDGVGGRQFEEKLEVLFRQWGDKVELTPYRGDYGADLILTRDRRRTAVQATGTAAGQVGHHRPMLRLRLFDRLVGEEGFPRRRPAAREDDHGYGRQGRGGALLRDAREVVDLLEPGVGGHQAFFERLQECRRQHRPQARHEVRMPGVEEDQPGYLLRIATGIQIGVRAARRVPDQHIGRPDGGPREERV